MSDVCRVDLCAKKTICIENFILIKDFYLKSSNLSFTRKKRILKYQSLEIKLNYKLKKRIQVKNMIYQSS